MTLIADSGALYALYDADDRHHQGVREVVEREPGPIVVPAILLAEIDYLLRRFLGVDAELDFVDSLLDGTFLLETSTVEDLPRMREIVARYRDLDLGLADAAVMATAERLEVRRILTVDERDFRAVQIPDGSSFTLVPADGQLP